MIVKALPACLIACLFVAACGAGVDRNREFTGDKARDLIRRNVLGGDNRFPIEKPYTYQYGSIHVDGPSGGMLYRFESSFEALNLIIDKHSLQQRTIDSLDQLPLDFLDDKPSWWTPPNGERSGFYYTVGEYLPSGERQFIAVFDGSAGIIYAVEHVANSRGI